MAENDEARSSGGGWAELDPLYAEWGALLRANAAAARSWTFTVAGMPAGELRALARREALAAAAAFSAKLGLKVAPPGSIETPIVVTGHQPELYHPGVWIKDFMLQRLADDTGASAIDLVVDTDGFDTVGVSTPCLSNGVHRCHQYLAASAPDACFATTPVPPEVDVDGFCVAGDTLLSTLPNPAPYEHFSAFCRELRAAMPLADNLAELVTIARRRYEEPVGTDYLELPVTAMVHGESFSAFAVEMALSADRFAEIYNASLADYRAANRTRSAAQPFPDLARDAERLELPLWLIDDGVRRTVWAGKLPGGGARVTSGDGAVIADLPADASSAVAALRASGAVLAPKALALTLFTRLFVSDLFIHGTGGGRYDRVTDDVCRRYFGVEPPAFVVATMTMYLPLGLPLVSDEDVSVAKERLNRLEHNPDASIEEATFLSAGQKERAHELASEKSGLVSAISEPDADKKALGLRIREVNADLASLLEPLRERLSAELAELEWERSATEILTDRTYPFCLFSPAEVAARAK